MSALLRLFSLGLMIAVWFAASQVAFGVVAGLVVIRHHKVWTSQNLPFAVRAGIEAPGMVDHGDEGDR